MPAAAGDKHPYKIKQDKSLGDMLAEESYEAFDHMFKVVCSCIFILYSISCTYGLYWQDYFCTIK